MTNTLFIAELDSLGYDFRAVAETENGARVCLRREWKRQVAAQYRDGVRSGIRWEDVEDGVRVWEARAGHAQMGW